MHSKDLDGDGRDDLIWQDVRTGYVSNWLGQVDGSFFDNIDGSRDLPTGQMFGMGDYNGDGRADTVWQSGNGEFFLSHTYPGAAFYFNWSTGFVANMPTGWNVATSGDFNGDGRDDLLLLNEGGRTTNWLGRADWGFDSNHVQASYVIPQGWHLESAGDFNGDGRDDLLLRNDNGTITNWLGQAHGGFFSNHESATYALLPEWNVAGVGDFNGDGRDDLLLRNDNGLVTEWLGQADGGFLSNHGIATYTLAIDWRVAETGDFNGDGRDDVLLRRHSGALTNWLGAADGTFLSNHEIATYAVDLSWQLQPNPSGAGYWDY